ncbi:hypothetical protein [Streptomyces iconiensis]|uniref:Uncharacterized protein n=1 Tax=Streptomyces iconiensis TaxID=1384038 RepID=A0ABT7AA52_9ACTN|nr:hypothetical protein [Streptomyces iconiensis]MDJ1137922.1 hypothetical protein [Streptomyces iconiensis]
MAPSFCATPIKGTHLRIVSLDFCGIPVTGASGLVVVSKGFVQVQQEPDYEDGEEFFERTADGTPCVNQKDDPTLKRVQLTTQFCEVNAAGTAYISSARPLLAGGTTTGFAVAEGNPVNRYSLEVWQQVAGSGACDSGGQQRYIYNAWPNVGASKIGNYTVENARSTLEVASETRAASDRWLASVGASWLPGETVETDEHWLWNITTTPPPSAQCDPTTLAA